MAETSTAAPPTASRRWPKWWPAVGLVVLVLADFGFSRAVSAGNVTGSVQVEGVELGGNDREDATAALIELENNLGADPVRFTVAGIPLDLAPATIGFDLAEGAMADEALAIGRNGNPFSEFGWWLTHLVATTDLPMRAAIDPAALETILSSWDIAAIGNPPFAGGVAIDGTSVAPEYPRAGRQIDRALAPQLILAQASKINRSVTDLPVSDAHPTLTSTAIDQAVAAARLILAGPVTLTNPERDKKMTFSVEHLAAALRPEVKTTEISFSMDPEVIGAALDALAAQLEDAPVDARFEVDGDTVTVVPGRKGTALNPELTARNLLAAAATASRTGSLPIDEAIDPEITTQQLEDLQIHHKVSQFTTYHPCCQNRVINIHLVADTVDGTIVGPGEDFSLNLAVGERTEEGGYLEDGTIIGGRLEQTIGGGVSQFATTFYNAVFWGGYEDISHKPHSFYFSRYPLGIEATISWPLPDLAFRNNTDSAILIKISYSNRSITVAFYSDNDGRILSGEQSDGQMRVAVIEEGGPGARIVKADISDPYNFREPPLPRYIADPTIVPPEVKEDQTPTQGYSINVTRTITQGDETTVDTWKVVYSPRQQIFLVNPCQLPDTTTPCPTTTTVASSTTIPSPTTVAN